MLRLIFYQYYVTKCIAAGISVTRPKCINIRRIFVDALGTGSKYISLQYTKTKIRWQVCRLVCRKPAPKQPKCGKRIKDKLLPTRTKINFITFKNLKIFFWLKVMESWTILCDYLCYKKHNYLKAEKFSKRLIYPQQVRKQKKWADISVTRLGRVKIAYISYSLYLRIFYTGTN